MKGSVILQILFYKANNNLFPLKRPHFFDKILCVYMAQTENVYSHKLYIFLYYVWRYFASIMYPPSFMQTSAAPSSELLGHYYQIAQTPNWFQKTGLASAIYQRTHDARSTDSFPRLQVTNLEYSRAHGKMALQRYVKGTLSETPLVDPGTYFVQFHKNNVVGYISPMGLYRILRFEKHHEFGTFLFVASYSPKYSWLLWKPPLDKASLLKAYDYALSLLWWFSAIGADTSSLKVIKPQELYELLELHEFS